MIHGTLHRTFSKHSAMNLYRAHGRMVHGTLHHTFTSFSKLLTVNLYWRTLRLAVRKPRCSFCQMKRLSNIHDTSSDRINEHMHTHFKVLPGDLGEKIAGRAVKV